DSVETRLGTLKFFDGLPDEATVQTVYDNLDFQRAVQAYLTALPAAACYAQRVGYRTFGPDNRTVLQQRPCRRRVDVRGRRSTGPGRATRRRRPGGPRPARRHRHPEGQTLRTR
ncbi:MAG: hypothetical protein WCP98_17530, partial [Actinomycetes bacterium]